MARKKKESGFDAVLRFMEQTSSDTDYGSRDEMECRIANAYLRLPASIWKQPAADVARVIHWMITEEYRAEIAEGKLKAIHSLAYLVDDAMIWLAPKWQAVVTWWKKPWREMITDAWALCKNPPHRIWHSQTVMLWKVKLLSGLVALHAYKTERSRRWRFAAVLLWTGNVPGGRA